MKSLALFTIALLLPITAEAQDQSEEISRLKSELKAAEEEKAPMIVAALADKNKQLGHQS
jgi:hypothetical protein